jgi:hypothetical protein
MFSFSFDIALPFNHYKELLDVSRKSPFPYIWWGVNISRSNSIFGIYFSTKPFRESDSNSLFFISIGLLTFDFEFSITSTKNK